MAESVSGRMASPRLRAADPAGMLENAPRSPPTRIQEMPVHPDAATVRLLLLRELEGVEKELDAYPDEGAVWARPPGVVNSGGTLVLHVAGNLRHYVGAVLGGSGYRRDREREFSAADVPREELRREIHEAKRAVDETLRSLDPDALARPYPEAVGGHRVDTGPFLAHLAAHLAYHLGQLDYHRRLVTGNDDSVGALSVGALAANRAVREGE